MNVLVSGSSGLIGAAVVNRLLSRKHQVTKLVRPGGPVGSGMIQWDPAGGRLDLSALEGIDAVVHLAGENIADERWSDKKKQRIRDSRIKGTTLLCGRLRALERPPQVAVFASAVGYYGDRETEELTEDSSPGTGFLSDVVREWEAATDVLNGTSIRTARLRIGVVLSSEGGALSRMLPMFRKGLGGKAGSGRQYLSWIAIDDLLSIVEYVLTNNALSGSLNAVAPNSVTNAEFVKTLGRVLGKPTFFSVPGAAARAAFGEMADALLLASTRVIPKRLLAAGFHFQYPLLEDALRHLLNK